MPMLRNTLKEKLAAGKLTRGLWVTLEAPTITEIAIELGFDWVTIDAEHGHLDFKAILEHVRATRGTDTTPLVRIAEVQQGLIKRVLDIGAAGIIVPQVTGPDEVAAAVRFAKYPPQGVRGVGGERATSWSMRLAESTRTANDQTMVIPLIETVAAFQSLDAIMSVPGVDALFIGPADLSASAGHLGHWEGPGVADMVLSIKDHAAARGLACGVMATSTDNARARRDQGFRMIGVASDTGLIIRGAQEGLRAIEG
ncbi:MAG TPA: aldolase/citrate lyase family protein [Pirellulales bacterium]